MKALIIAVFTGLGLVFSSFEKKELQLSYLLNADSSKVEWSGSSPKVSHQGSFAVESEGIDVVDGRILGGTFIIPIASIKNYDLPKAVKPVLLKHLKSEDFFNIALHPEAFFTITSVAPLENWEGKTIEGANNLVTGNFTMLGVTNEISFPAKIEFEDDELSVEADLTIDRTQWGMNYAADPDLGKRHIHADVDIHLRIYGNRRIVTAGNN